MQIETTTTVKFTDELGREISTVSRIERKDVGGNARFFISEGMETVLANAETVLVNAAIGVDRVKAPSN